MLYEWSSARLTRRTVVGGDMKLSLEWLVPKVKARQTEQSCPDIPDYLRLPAELMLTNDFPSLLPRISALKSEMS